MQSRRAPAFINTCHDARFAPHFGANVNAGYNGVENSLDPQTKLDKFLPVLLRLGKVRNQFTNQDLLKTDFMEDMIAQMKLVDGVNKNLGWSNEITAWP